MTSAKAPGSMIDKHFPLMSMIESSFGKIIPDKHLIKVLLPEPLGPIIPSRSPSLSSKFKFCNA